MYGHGKAPHRATLYAGSASMPRPWIPFGLNSEAWEKRGHIYRTGSLTQGTNEAHRFPCCSARYRCSPSEPQRTRDGHCWPPPAQIRTSPIRASGSYLGCVTANRVLGQGCRMRGLGSQSFASRAIRSQVRPCRWLRRRSERRQRLTTWCRNATSARLFVGTA